MNNIDLSYDATFGWVDPGKIGEVDLIYHVYARERYLEKGRKTSFHIDPPYRPG
jgi:hypothetical protein